MASNKYKIYWDTNIFLAWLKGESQEPAVMDGIIEVVQNIRLNKIILMTSVTTRTEVLDATLSEEAQKKFSKLFDRRNVQMINLDHRIADKSHFIRNFYHEKGIKLSTMDCQHLATAIIYRADEFQTLDGSGKRKRPNDLIPLSGNVAGYKLNIRTPSASQTTMFSTFAERILKNKYLS